MIDGLFLYICYGDMCHNESSDGGDTHTYGVMCSNKSTDSGNAIMVIHVIIKAVTVVIHTQLWCHV